MSEPFAPLRLGNIADDDAQVIDDLVESQAEPPKPVADEMVTDVVERPAPVTRLQTGRQLIVAGWDPVMVLPKDVHRKSMQVAMNSADTTDSVYVGSDPQDARNGGSLYMANPLTLNAHTGPVWVYNPTSHDVTVSWWAVTK